MTKKLSLHLSLLKRAMLRSRWTPAQTGTQGLFRLVKQAHETYKAEVSTLQRATSAMRLISFIQISSMTKKMPGAKMNTRRTTTP